MLGAMDSGVPATGPEIVLALAAALLVVLLALLLRWHLRAGGAAPATTPEPAAPRPATDRPFGDDLPGFLRHPPGSAGRRAPRAAAGAEPVPLAVPAAAYVETRSLGGAHASAVPASSGRPPASPTVRSLAGLAALAMLLVVAVAVTALAG